MTQHTSCANKLIMDQDDSSHCGYANDLIADLYTSSAAGSKSFCVVSWRKVEVIRLDRRSVPFHCPRTLDHDDDLFNHTGNQRMMINLEQPDSSFCAVGKHGAKPGLPSRRFNEIGIPRKINLMSSTTVNF